MQDHQLTQMERDLSLLPMAQHEYCCSCKQTFVLLSFVSLSVQRKQHMAYYGWVREGGVVYLWPACPWALTHKTGETISHGQNSNVKEVVPPLAVSTARAEPSHRWCLEKQLLRDRRQADVHLHHVLSPVPCPLPSLPTQPPSHPAIHPPPPPSHTHAHCQLQGQRPAHMQQHKFYNLTSNVYF